MNDSTGQIAVEMGFLTPEQLSQLLQKSTANGISQLEKAKPGPKPFWRDRDDFIDTFRKVYRQMKDSRVKDYTSSAICLYVNNRPLLSIPYMTSRRLTETAQSFGFSGWPHAWSVIANE